MFFNAILWSQEWSLMWTLFWRNKNKERKSFDTRRTVWPAVRRGKADGDDRLASRTIAGHDALWIRILLVILWVNDSFATATEIFQVYMYTIVKFVIPTTCDCDYTRMLIEP
jgi:hypothetical protein